MGSEAATGAKVRRWSGQGPCSREGLAVFGGGVAFVRGEAVLRVDGRSSSRMRASRWTLAMTEAAAMERRERVAVVEAGLGAGVVDVGRASMRGGRGRR